MANDFFQVLLPLLSIGIVSLVAGLPIVLRTSTQFNGLDRRVAIASAPIWGALAIGVLSTWAQATALSPKAWTLALLVASVAFCAWTAVARNSIKQTATDIALAVLSLCVVIALVVLINGRDLTQVGLTAYFPLTNADTFNYLGLIEQIREFGTVTPRMHYPDGTSIRIEHATVIRLAAASVVAALSAIANIDTTQGMFLCLRLGLVLAVLGAVLVTAAATRNATAALLVGLLCVGSNVLLPQTLQQFLSSVLGLSQLTAVGLAAVWSIRNGMHSASVFLLGIALGSYALMSPESHGFIFIALFLVFLVTALPRRPLAIVLWSICVFMIGYLLAIGPLLGSYFPALVGQIGGTIQHPGDFFAAPGALLYASGIAVWDGRPFADYRSYEQLMAITMVSMYVIAATFCIWQGKNGRGLATHDRQILLFFGITASVTLGAQAFAYLTGRGFLLSKLVDYFCFFYFVVAAVSITSLVSNLRTHGLWLRVGRPSARLIWTMVLIFAALHTLAALNHKNAFLETYVRNINSAPTTEDYRFMPMAPATISGLWADLGDDVMNRYLWENRWRRIPLYVPPELAARFTGGTPLSSVSHVLRMSGGAVGTAAVVDINRARDVGESLRVSIVPIRNYLKIIEGLGWLGPEGDSPGVVWRWLSRHGRFMILNPCTPGKALTLEMTAGPDGGLENDVEIYFGNKRRIALVRADEIIKQKFLTQMIQLPSICNDAPVEGSIVVTGPTTGIRQVRIGALYITDFPGRL